MTYHVMTLTPSPREVRLAPLDTNAVFQSLGAKYKVLGLYIILVKASYQIILHILIAVLMNTAKGTKGFWVT